MPRKLRVSAAQMGPVQSGEDRRSVVRRLQDLLREAAHQGAQVVVFPELALTPFFPHRLVEDEVELDRYFEQGMPNEDVAPLFESARELGVAFNLGFAELVTGDSSVRRFNTSVLVGPDGSIVGKYRKIHLPGFTEVEPEHPFPMLEKRYFELGDLGLPVWDLLDARIGLCICNDRRWPEVYRALGRQGAELVLLGYNTPTHNPLLPESDRLIPSHNHLNMQAGALQNGIWVVGTAKAGIENGIHLIAGSCIIAPTGEIVALATSEEDEVITADVDLELSRRYQERSFSVFADSQPDAYVITQEY
jgi:predicted amidohydrolase